MPDDYRISTNHAGDVTCYESNGNASLPLFSIVFSGSGRFLSTAEKAAIAEAALTELKQVLSRPAEPLPEWTTTNLTPHV